jgi:F0F1-type ATP synthase membrane subunit b/b'
MRPTQTLSLASIPRPLLLLSLMLFSGSWGYGRVNAAQPQRDSTLLLAQVSVDDINEIDQIRQEADLAFRRATTLFFVLLGTLVLLLGIGVVMLWLLRRSVIQEVSVVVRNQLNDITDLETKVQTATRELDRILSQAEEMSDEIDTRTNRFQEEATTKKQVLNRLVDDLAEFKARTLNDWQSTLADLQVKLEKAEADFVGNLTGLRQHSEDQLTTLRKETQMQRDSIGRVMETTQTDFLRDANRLKNDLDVQQDAVMQKLQNTESLFVDQVGALTAGVHEERDRTLTALADLRQQLTPHLDSLKAQAKEDIEQHTRIIANELNDQRQISLERITAQETEVNSQLADIQASAFGHKDLAIQNIERSIDEFSQRFANLRTEVENQRNRILKELQQSADNFFAQFSGLEGDINQRQDALLKTLQQTADASLERFSTVQAEVESRQQTLLGEFDQVAEDFRSQLSLMAADADTQKTSILDDLQASANAFTQQIQLIQDSTGEQQTQILDRLRAMEIEFTAQLSTGPRP